MDDFNDRKLPPNGVGPGVAISLHNGRRLTIANCAATVGDKSFVSAENVSP